jgi:lycopene cyclase domain-containing protein
MTYFGFLARFVLLPLLIIWWLIQRDDERGKKPPRALDAMPAAATLTGMATVAVAYTTPWDNYLVANRIWWYDRKLVTGLVLGYVPIEEYCFFVLQTLLTGSWMLWLSRHIKTDDKPPANPLLIRAGVTAALGVIWLGALWNLLRGPKSRTYISITLVWALPALMFQTAFGADILWQHRKLVALGIVPTTIYLGVADSLAIEGGTWTIAPDKQVNVQLGGKLPLEEGLFFLLTNTLIAMGVTLVQAEESRRRVPKFLHKYLPKPRNSQGDA